MELIREILLELESESKSDALERNNGDELKYHQALVIEAGLAQGNVTKTLSNTTNSPDHVILRRLTWEGHEFLDSVRQEQVWNTVKSEFKDATLETVISASKQLAEGRAKKKSTGIA